MSSSVIPRREALARAARAARCSQHARRMALVVGAAALQCACSLLIQIDDGTPPAPDASTARGSNQPRATQSDAGDTPAPTLRDAGGDAATDAGTDAGRALPPRAPGLLLAFIERPQESEAALRLVDPRAALEAQAGDDSAVFRRTLRPSAQAGGVLDFAWSPNGQRLALRYDTLGGPRLALFAAPDWRELPIATSSSAASQPRTTASARYRWSPDGAALALELASAQGPLVGGFVVSEAGARELPAVAFSGPIETLDWLSPSALFVMQPEAGEPELLELQLQEGAFSSPEARDLLAAFFPIELRRAASGLIGASTDPTRFVFFWPETPEAGFETAFTPAAYLSSRDSFAAEPDEASATSSLFPIGDSSQLLDTLPACPVVLTWAEGPSPRSLAQSSIACLSVTDAVPRLSVYSYDAAGERRARRLDDPALLADLAVAASWEGQARSLAASGEWLAISTVQHDVIVDLRGSTPLYQLRAAASSASTARGFSASGRYLLEQRGRQLDLAVLAPAPGVAPMQLALPEAALQLVACDSARHAASFCGAPRAARLAAARWSASADVAALLTANEGLVLLVPSEDSVGFRHVAVSSCGSGCVTQYEFSE